MDELANVFARGDMNQVMINNEERPPPRNCPRCNSDNTKFCYYNNYTVSQPRYFCKNCRRYWTHGGALRNIPIGGSCRKPKRTSKPDQQQQVVSVDNNTQQDTNHHQNQQPFLNVQETNEFLGNFHHETNYYNNHAGGIVTNAGPIQTSRPVLDRLDFSDDVAYQQDYYDVGSNDLIGNPLINQAIAGSNVVNSDYNQWNQGFDNNTMSMNHGASTSGDRGTSSNGRMNIVRNTFVFRPTYHFEKHGP